jgi:fatty-acyl-CoA synthase
VRLAEAIERWGPVFAQYFGQSECPMVISYLRKDEHDVSRPERLASCGRPSAFLRTALLDEAGDEVAAGEPGEVCVAGPVVADGYWNLPDATAETFRDGWLRTGDVAKADDEGFWYIVDRTKDMIVTGGFNVFPREVEDVIAEHPAVSQVGVVGVPDEKWGEAVTAVVVLRPEADRGEEALARLAEELKAAVKDRKGAVQAPKQVVVTDALPLTGLGKPDKKALRARFWQDRERAVG